MVTLYLEWAAGLPIDSKEVRKGGDKIGSRSSRKVRVGKVPRQTNGTREKFAEYAAWTSQYRWAKTKQ